MYLQPRPARLLILAAIVVPFTALAFWGAAALAQDGTGMGSGDAEYIESMAEEHAGDAPVANPSLEADPRMPVTGVDAMYGRDADGTLLVGYAAYPTDADTTTLPVIVMIHEWWGLNDNVRRMAELLAGEGYGVLAVDLYYGQVGTTPEEARALMTTAIETPELALANLAQAAGWLSSAANGAEVGVIGWCFGGGWSLQTALTFPDDVRAVVMYYGQVVEDTAALSTLDAPLLGVFGADDQGIPVGDVQAMELALTALGKDATVLIYDGAGHAFANPSGHNYQAEPAEDAWQRTLEFFGAHLRGDAVAPD